MNRKEALDYCNQQEPSFLVKAKKRVHGHPTYICPICQNGSGKDGSGIEFNPKSKHIAYTCFKCDGTNGKSRSTSELFFAYEGVINPKREDFDRLFAYYNVTPDEDGNNTYNDVRRDFNSQAPRKIDLAQYPKEEEPRENQEANYKIWHSQVSQTDYWQRRGISQATIDKFNLGFCRKGDPKCKYNKYDCVIIPTTPYNYVQRNIPQDATKMYTYGSKRTFNIACVTTSERPIFITEGEIDALSIEELGFNAVALGQANGSETSELVKLLKKNKPKIPFIISFDNDKPSEREPDGHGQTTSKALSEVFERLNIPYFCLPLKANQENPNELTIASFYLGQKDANEALLQDKEAFRSNLLQVEQLAIAKQEADRIKAIEDYKKTASLRFQISDFIKTINSTSKPCIPTGFTMLDEQLDGGFYEGLYIIGAISSLGKTTFSLQIADQVARSGQDVLIFSLEMSQQELIAKSISRHTFIKELSKTTIQKASTSQASDFLQRFPNSRTVRSLQRLGQEYNNYQQEQVDHITESIKDYCSYNSHLYVIEQLASDKNGTDEIRRAIEKHIDLTGNKPLVIIDYLQIMRRQEKGYTDKQKTDDNVTELRQVSRDLHIPILAISSFNRESYKVTASFSSFKESGAIEYSSDVLIGLQLAVLSKKETYTTKDGKEKTKPIEYDLDEEKTKTPRSIELVILKNRNGRTGGKIPYSYIPMFNYFDEDLSTYARQFKLIS